MATHSSILAWEIPRPEEPGGLQSMGSKRIRHNWTQHTDSLEFLTTAVTNDHRVDSLKHRNLFSPTVVKVRSLNSRYHQGCAPSESFLACSTFWWLQAPVDLGLHESHLCLRLYMACSSVCLSLKISLYLYFRRTTVIGFRAHCKSRTILFWNNYTYKKSISRKIHIHRFQGLGYNISFWDHHSIHSRWKDFPNWSTESKCNSYQNSSCPFPPTNWDVHPKALIDKNMQGT